MQSDDRVEVGLGRAHLHGHAEALQDLINGHPNHMQPNHPLLLAHAHELGACLWLRLAVDEELA